MKSKELSQKHMAKFILEMMHTMLFITNPSEKLDHIELIKASFIKKDTIVILIHINQLININGSKIFFIVC